MSDSKKILVIDDDVDILDSIALILEKNGYEVAKAGSGEEGKQKYHSETPDLILCDLMMEEIDKGFNVAEEINRENPDIPIILLSSAADSTYTNVDINKAGFAAAIQKPVNPEALVKLIESKLS